MRKNICGLSCRTAFNVFSIFMTYNFNRPYLAFIIKIIRNPLFKPLIAYF
nr:MAG TPA: Pardaxin [Caudoviricetes sp.]